MHALIKDVYIPITLPWPPSVNTLWRRHGNNVLVSKKYREYKKLIQQYAVLYKRKALTGRISVEIKAYPPDKRRRDIDNISKAILDCLQNARFFLDDSQIDKLSIERMFIKKNGEIKVFIKEIESNSTE